MYLDYATRQARRHIPMTMEGLKELFQHAQVISLVSLGIFL